MTVNLPPSPFKGLAYFGDSEHDWQFFFGRERESELVAANLMASRLTVLYGPSGVGQELAAPRRCRAPPAILVPAAGGEDQGAEVVIVDTWRDDPVAAVAAAAQAPYSICRLPTLSPNARSRDWLELYLCSTRWRSTSSTTAATGARSPASSKTADADLTCRFTCCSASATTRSPTSTRSSGASRLCSGTSCGSTT